MSAVAAALSVSRPHLASSRQASPAWKPRGRRGRPPAPDAALLGAIQALIADLPTYGYRRVHALLRRQAERDGRPAPNAKRVYRVMKVHGLLLQRHVGGAETRRHEGKVAVATRNTRWCSDGLEIAAENGERVRVAFALDCCDREAMSYVATTAGITGEDVRDLMVAAVEHRFGAVNQLPSLIEWLTDPTSYQPQPQPDEGATYAPKIEKAEARIDWTQPAEAIERQVRAFAPAPGAWFEVNGERLKLLDAVAGEDSNGKLGEVLDDSLNIACGEGHIRPLRVQRAGKSAMTPAELLRGFAIPKGSILPSSNISSLRPALAHRHAALMMTTASSGLSWSARSHHCRARSCWPSRYSALAPNDNARASAGSSSSRRTTRPMPSRLTARASSILPSISSDWACSRRL